MLRSLLVHPQPSSVLCRSRHDRFLGEELPSDGLSGSPWLVRAVLGDAPALELRRDGLLPARISRVLPLRHGFAFTGLPATCLLEAPGVARLRLDPLSGDREVECTACRAWQGTHGCLPRRGSPMVDRILAALGQVFSHAT